MVCLFVWSSQDYQMMKRNMAQWQQACYFLVVCDHVCPVVLNGLVCECQTSQRNAVNEASVQSSFNMLRVFQQRILDLRENKGSGGKNKMACVSAPVTCSRCHWWHSCIRWDGPEPDLQPIHNNYTSTINLLIKPWFSWAVKYVEQEKLEREC